MFRTSVKRGAAVGGEELPVDGVDAVKVPPDFVMLLMEPLSLVEWSKNLISCRA